MNAHLLRLQTQYANAVYLSARYAREAEIAKQLLDELADDEARSQFANRAEVLPSVAAVMDVEEGL